MKDSTNIENMEYKNNTNKKISYLIMVFLNAM